ncbi:MAG: hypothetical protein O2901_12915 [Verrucomicrobia bacterium]|nr:hypothetical protein [Verrucomicrobiota bacterium]
MKKLATCLAVLGMLGMVGMVEGGITLNSPRTFDSGTDGWFTDGGTGDGGGTTSLSNPSTGSPSPGGNPGGYMGINIVYGGPPLPQDPSISNTTELYTGDYSIAESIQFDFIAYDHAPAVGSAVVLYTSTGGTWTHAFTYLESQVGSWVHFVVPLAASAWVGGVGDFQTAIGPNTVTGVGLDIEGAISFGGTQRFGIDSFGIDNWQYTIPEPRTYFMLAAALLGLASTFRRPIQDSLAKIKKAGSTSS